MYRNLIQTWIVFAFDETDGTPKTGDAANITAKISKNGALAVALNDVNPIERESGYYVFDITAAESDALNLTIIPSSSTANIQVVGAPASVETFEHVISGLCTTGGATDSVKSTLQTTHSLTTSNALIGRVLIFDANTSTTALRHQAGEITGYNGATGEITFAVGTFTTAHSVSDTFKIY